MTLRAYPFDDFRIRIVWMMFMKLISRFPTIHAYGRSIGGIYMVSPMHGLEFVCGIMIFLVLLGIFHLTFFVVTIPRFYLLSGTFLTS
jgi:hypothetical protein